MFITNENKYDKLIVHITVVLEPSSTTHFVWAEKDSSIQGSGNANIPNT